MEGFLGTPASIMLDVIVCSLVLVVPTLSFSIYLVRWRKNYLWHKRIQISLGVVLLIIVLLFEIDMRRQGGFWTLAADSPYADGRFLPTLLGVHLTFSISTVLFWFITFITALRRFSNPPAPGVFSPVHKTMAWIAVADMVATVVTGLMVYYFGFIAE